MPKYYLLDENKNLVEGFDKEGFLALLQQAIDQGSLENIDPESAVASKLRSLVNGSTHHIEFVTEAQYNQLEHDGQLIPNTYYFITDDTTLEGMEEAINNLTDRLTNVEEIVNGIVDGTRVVGKATNAEKTSFTNNGWQSVQITGETTHLFNGKLTKNLQLLLYIEYDVSTGLGVLPHGYTYDLGIVAKATDLSFIFNVVSSQRHRELGMYTPHCKSGSFNYFSFALQVSEIETIEFVAFIMGANTSFPSDFFTTNRIKLYYKEID